MLSHKLEPAKPFCGGLRGFDTVQAIEYSVSGRIAAPAVDHKR
jgi:hypothetical protein